MRLRVVQVNCVKDAQDRDPEALLDAWPTLPLIAGATARAGAEVIVLQASRRAADFERNDVRYRFEPGRLAAAVWREAPDIVHFNGLGFPFQARALCATGTPVLVQDHASRPAQRWRSLYGWGYAQVKAAAFTSADQAAPFIANGQLPRAARIFAIPESSSSFTPGPPAPARRETGMYGDPALLWIGHLDANKDPLTILLAVRIALAALPGLQLWCAFAGEQLRPEIEKLLHADPLLAAHVHLLGRVPHARIETLCRAADFYVGASHREGSGYALIEAMACGLTPIVSDIPSFRALTGNGAVGALAPPGDVQGFADAIVAQASRRRSQVRAHFDRHLSFDRVGAQLLQAYAGIARRSAR